MSVEYERKAMDELSDAMQRRKERTMEPMKHEQQETETRVARMLRAAFRPALHAGAEILGCGTIAAGAIIGLTVVMIVAITLTEWAIKTAGIPTESAQALVLTLGICGGGLWAFVSETRRFSKAVREWTNNMHKQIKEM